MMEVGWLERDETLAARRSKELRAAVSNSMRRHKMLENTLTILGYRPEDDAWDTDGRRTYSHNDDATRAYLTTLHGILGRQGFKRDFTTLRVFRREGEIVAIEPGGADTNGHYLHHMKAHTG